MKKTVLKYGIYGALVICVLFLTKFFLGKDLSFKTQEWLGYGSIVISLLFIFFGIKHYRDRENNGVVGFGKALKIGLLISIIVSLAFGLLNIVYVEIINPDFMTEYYAYMVDQVKENFTGAELETKLQEMQDQKEMFSNLGFSTFIMFMTVFMIGLIMSLLSSLILQRKN